MGGESVIFSVYGRKSVIFSVYGREKCDFLCLWEGKVWFSLFMGGKSVIFVFYITKYSSFC